MEMDIEKISKRLEEEGCRVLTEDELRLQVNGGWGRSSSSSSSSSRSSSSGSRGSSSSGGSSSRSSGSSGRNSSGASKKSESGATKTKTSLGQSIKNFAEKYASSNWQKNHPDFGAHSSRSSNNGNNGYNGGSYSGGGSARAVGKNGTGSSASTEKEAAAGSEEAKTGENTAANGTAPATAKASAPQPKSQKRETFSYKNVGFVNQKTKNYTQFKTVIPTPSSALDKSNSQKNLEKNIQTVYPANLNISAKNSQQTQSKFSLSGSGVGIDISKNSVLSIKTEGSIVPNFSNKSSWAIQKSYPEGAIFGVSVTTPIATFNGKLDNITVKFETQF